MADKPEKPDSHKVIDNLFLCIVLGILAQAVSGAGGWMPEDLMLYLMVSIGIAQGFCVVRVFRIIISLRPKG